MVNERSITVNGDLGSGKSTVSVGLAERLELRRISVGDLYRQMARERGMSALEINLHAELDDAIDATVDNMQREIAESGEQVVMDSRLAWHFFTERFQGPPDHRADRRRPAGARPAGQRRRELRDARPRPRKTCAAAARASASGS